MSGTVSGFWSHCLNHFERELSAQQFATWFRVLSAEETDSSITVVAPNAFVSKWVRDRYLSTIDSLATAYFPEPRTVRLAVASAAVNGHQKIAERTAPATIAASTASPVTAGPVPETPLVVTAVDSGSSAITGTAARESTLNSSFTFDSFVTGKANQLARAAAMQVAGNPGDAYNPLFIYGGVGLGKTHLLQAIGNQLLREHPTARVRYIHAERYVSDVVKAYQHKAWDAFKQSYASLDLLLIDDIQFFAGKERSQEEFFYAFENLIAERKQIIITSDTYPKEMSGIDDRLISRFNSGLIVAIEPPELEMRVAILMRKAEFGGHPLDEDVAFFVAKHIRQNVRELEGALRRILAYAQFRQQPITLELVKEALKDLLSFNRGQISVEFIQKTVADFYKMKVADMYSKRRPANIALPRQIAMYLAKELTQKSLPEIGELFGGRDHTTVLHAVRKIAELRQHRPELNHQIHVLEQTLREYL